MGRLGILDLREPRPKRRRHPVRLVHQMGRRMIQRTIRLIIQRMIRLMILDRVRTATIRIETAVNQALKEVRANGEYNKLFHKWFHNVKGFDYEEAAKE